MGLKKQNTPGDYSCNSQLSLSPCSSPVMLKKRCHSVLYCSYCHIRRVQYKPRSEGCLGSKHLTIEVKSLGKQR